MHARRDAPREARAVDRQCGFDRVFHARVSRTLARWSLVADEWYRSAGGLRSRPSTSSATLSDTAREAWLAKTGVAPAPRKARRLPDASATPARPTMA